MKKKKFITVILLFIIIIAQTGCAGRENIEPVSKENYCLDTICNITIYSMDNMSKEKALEAIDEAYKICNEYEKLFSKTIKDSDIYKINHAGGRPVKCSEKTIRMIKQGIKYGEISDGIFDITVGKMTDLWDFHASNPKLPTDEAVKEAVKDVDYKQIHIDGNTVTMANPKGEIDLGGIAKGYIADRMAEYLEKKGVKGAVINLGGNVYVLGHKDGKEEDFKIGIRKPYGTDNDIIGAVNISNGTVVTSGPYERYFDINGKRYHHILDVKTGYPAESDVNGVTIVGPKGTSSDCDALSTTCYILGPEKGCELIRKLKKYEAIFIMKDGKIIKSDEKYSKFQSED